MALLLAAGGVLIAVLIGIDSAITGGNSQQTSPVGGLGAFAALGVAVYGTVTAFRLRPVVFAARPMDDRQPAVAAALAARGRRTAARELIAKDPALARELRIGRPDLSHDYDDGGLVDLNHAPGAVLAEHFKWSPEQVESIVTARERLGGFSFLEEIATLTAVDQRSMDAAAEHAVLIP